MKAMNQLLVLAMRSNKACIANAHTSMVKLLLSALFVSLISIHALAASTPQQTAVQAKLPSYLTALNQVEIRQTSDVSALNLIPSGDDPYVILTLRDEWISESENGQIITFPFYIGIDSSFENAFEKAVELRPSIGLFFKLQPHTNDQFKADPNYFAQYTIEVKSLDKALTLSILDSAPISSGELVRLDLERCNGCKIVFAEPLQVDPNSALSSYRFINGLDVLDQGTLTPIALDAWTLNNLELVDGRIVPIAQDPFLILSGINLDSSSLGGFLFDIAAHQIDDESRSNTDSQTKVKFDDSEMYGFQIFHADSLHSITGKVSTQFKVELDKLEDGAANDTIACIGSTGSARGIRGAVPTMRLFIPMNHIMYESSNPSAHAVRAFRFDLPNRLDTSWSLCSAAFVPISIIDDFLSHQPHLLSHTSYNALSGSGLAYAVLRNLSRDWFFLSFLFALIVLISYRSTKLLTGKG